MNKSLAPLRNGIGIALFLSMIWGAAAAVQPTSTYHLAPLLIVGAVPFAARGQSVGNFLPTLIGAAIALVAAGAIAALDLLRGPSLLPVGDAFLEALVFAVVGALAGFAVVRAVPTR